ncbi:DUF4878 domain-containing protein [Halarcobacter sp.]|uniref:DUF4878 domain-containing protein n=1 Tax=Halarcobacter sp. TaxID=2321133 RepID=UPI0029F58181|nr:DUF4878 domain-containing protein [Halarcobacter sp.]
MKNIMKIGLFTLLSAILYTGCGSSGPIDVTENFVESFKDGDIESLKKYSTETAYSIFIMGVQMQCGNKKISSCMEEMSENQEIIKYELVKETESKAIVNVITEENGVKKVNKYDLRKFEDGWKIDLKK